jgi:excisionase family DNA binding protein
MNTPPEPVAVPVRGFATRLGVSESHIWKLLRENQLAAIRIGRRTLVPLTELDRLLAQASTTAA